MKQDPDRTFTRNISGESGRESFTHTNAKIYKQAVQQKGIRKIYTLTTEQRLINLL